MNPATQVPHGTATMTKGMVLLFAFCCGAIVANIYYAQPIRSASRMAGSS